MSDGPQPDDYDDLGEFVGAVARHALGDPAAERDRLRAGLERIGALVGVEYGDGIYEAVAVVVAERDRLRAAYDAATEAADAAAGLVGAMAEKLSAVLAENARLRAVVEAARNLLANGDDVFRYEAAREDLANTLGQLDGTGVIGGKDELLTTTEAARILGVSRPHLIDKLLDTGVIPHFRTGRDRRIKRIDVEAYKRQRESSAGGATDG